MYMKARDQGASQTKAAALVNISERSGQRIESGSHQPKRGKPRDWRTRSDPLEEVWTSDLEPMLRDDCIFTQLRQAVTPNFGTESQSTSAG